MTTEVTEGTEARLVSQLCFTLRSSATSAFEQSSAICLCVLCDLVTSSVKLTCEKWAEAHATGDYGEALKRKERAGEPALRVLRLRAMRLLG